eukprot:1180100-Prorocentrum_minimum.AAC.1
MIRVLPCRTPCSASCLAATSPPGPASLGTCSSPQLRTDAHPPPLPPPPPPPGYGGACARPAKPTGPMSTPLPKWGWACALDLRKHAD